MSVDLVARGEVALRALADPIRSRIVELLAGEQLCVCHLTEELDAAQPLVSHHLKVLRDAGLVEGERFRYWTYYRLRPDALRAVADGLERLAETAPTGSAERRPCC
jgi:ArsR family transcriptional regulator